MHLIRMLWSSASKLAKGKYADVYGDCIELRTALERDGVQDALKLQKQVQSAKTARKQHYARVLNGSGAAATTKRPPKTAAAASSKSAEMDAIPKQFLDPTSRCGSARASEKNVASASRKRKICAEKVEIPLLLDAVADAFQRFGHPRPSGPQAVWDAVLALRGRVNAARDAANEAFDSLCYDLMAAMDDVSAQLDNPPLRGTECDFLF